MKISGIYSQALLGIQRGLKSAQEHAGQIASAGQFQSDDTAELTGSLVGLKQDKIQVQASAQVFRAMDAMIGVLLDEEV